MSLRAVHIFLISTSIALAVFFGVWAIKDYLSPAKSTANLYLGVLSFVVAVALVVYLFGFFLKIKKDSLS